ncbi:MAG: pyridoxal-phosphate dependent enzyme, partial [Hyphomicrobiaceae bacterium]
MSRVSKPNFTLQLNPSANHGSLYGPDQKAVLDTQGLARARAIITAWPGYQPTPLLQLPGLARATRVCTVHLKDESQRFGLKSFKPLGGAYAVASLLLKNLENSHRTAEITVEDLLRGKYASHSAAITVCAATDGNHGRSVAWGAQLFGCRCVIFINEAVSFGREQAIAAYGAEVRRIPGSFDDAVRAAQRISATEGWFVIPDTSDGNIIDAPRDVTQG